MPRMGEETGYIPLPGSDGDHHPTLQDFEGIDPGSALAPQQQKDWLRVDAHGAINFVKVGASGKASPCSNPRPSRSGICLVQVDKHAMVTDLGIHYRDLRTVDPLVGCASTQAVQLQVCRAWG